MRQIHMSYNTDASSKTGTILGMIGGVYQYCTHLNIHFPVFKLGLVFAQVGDAMIISAAGGIVGYIFTQLSIEAHKRLRKWYKRKTPKS